MGSYVSYSNRIHFTYQKMTVMEKHMNQCYFDDLDENLISEIIQNERISTIQISEYIPEYKLSLFNQLFQKKPALTFRVFGFHSDKVCDLSFLKYLPSIKRLSIDYIRNVENLSILDELELDYLRLYIFDLKDYSILQSLKPTIENLSIYYENKGKANFDGEWLLRFSDLKELYLGKVSKNIDKIAELKELRKLTLRGIKLDSLAFLNKSSITNLSIHWTSMNDFASLCHNSKIESLELWRIMKLEDVSFISTLENLKTLRLIDLANVTSLPTLDGLENIYLENLKNLTDVSNVNQTNSIEMIGVQKLPINEIASLYKNEHIDKISLRGLGSKKRSDEVRLLEEKYQMSRWS